MNNKWLITGLLWGGFILLGYFGGWWEIVYPETGNSVKSVQPSQPASVTYDGELTGWEEHELAWKIKAVKIWESSDGNQVYFEDISQGIIYTDKDGEVYFKAKWARWERAREELNISGGLEAYRDDEFFSTAEAVMKYKTEELHSLAPIEYRAQDLQVKAEQMRMKFKAEEIWLEGNVELIQEGDVARAEGLIYWRKDKKFKLFKPKEAVIKP